jgi:hypothetical protein
MLSPFNIQSTKSFIYSLFIKKIRKVQIFFKFCEILFFPTVFNKFQTKIYLIERERRINICMCKYFKTNLVTNAFMRIFFGIKNSFK